MNGSHFGQLIKICLLVTLLWFILLLTQLSFMLDKDIFTLLNEFSFNIHGYANANTMTMVNFGKISPLSFMYLLVLFTFVTVFVLCRTTSLLKNTPTLQALIASVLSVFVLILFLQTSAQYKNLRIYMEQFSGTAHAERNAIVAGDVYIFSQFCRRHIKGHQSAELITDMDMSKDPGMLNHRQLAYYLYPVDIRDVRREEKKLLIIYRKAEPEKHVPNGYDVVARYDKNSLIARKK